MYSARYSCPILMELEFFGQIFEKFWNIKFYENPFLMCGSITEFTLCYLY
jgi:hypothetical protein